MSDKLGESGRSVALAAGSLERPRVVVLGTGGTIAGTAADAGDNIGYTAAQVGVAQLLDAIPALRGAACEIVAEQVAQVDSKDMEATIWHALATRAAFWLAQDGVAGLVVTHGTDTLEETAYFLQAVLDPAKPVVLTCAMRPATALAPDGPQNVLDAVAVASLPGARGVVAVCAGVIHGAFDVQKVHTYRLDAFGSGDAGPIGYVEEGRVRQLRPWPSGGRWGGAWPLKSDRKEPSAQSECAQDAIKKRVVENPALASAAAWPRVEIVMSHAGAGAGLVQALVDQGVRGLVVAATGNGTVHHALEAGLRAAMESGVQVLRATRCTGGRILATPGDSIPEAGSLSPVKARVALTLALLSES